MAFRRKTKPVVPDERSPLMTAREAAAYLKFRSVKSIHRMIQRGIFSAGRIEGRYRLRRDEVEAYAAGVMRVKKR